MRSFVRIRYLAKLFISAWILVENFISNLIVVLADTSCRLKKDLNFLRKFNLCFANSRCYDPLSRLIMMINLSILLFLVVIKKAFLDNHHYQIHHLLVTLYPGFGNQRRLIGLLMMMDECYLILIVNVLMSLLVI